MKTTTNKRVNTVSGLGLGLLAASLSLGTLQAGAQTGQAAPGGVNGPVSLEGCVNEFLFNGIWRMRVLEVKPISVGKADGPYRQTGWAVVAEVRNGSAAGESLSLSRGGVDVNLMGVDLILDNGDTLNPVSFAAGASGPLYDSGVTFKDVPQGGSLKLTLPYLLPLGGLDAGPRKPAKFLVRMDPKGVGSNLVKIRSRFTTPNPGFRVNLTCKK